MKPEGAATKGGHTSVLVRTEGSETLLSTFRRSMMPVAKTLRVLVFREKCPLPQMIFDMVDVRSCPRSTFLRATSAIGLLGEPLPFDRFPRWRFIPGAPLDAGFSPALSLPISG
jgi:hypothetical protein